MTIDEASIAVFFQRLINAIIKNDKTEAILANEFLKDTLVSTPEALHVLSLYQQIYLKKVMADFENNTFTRAFNVHKPAFSKLSIKLDRQIVLEKDLKNFLLRNYVFEKALSIKAVDTETPTTYGNIDILYETSRTKIPCELKIGIAHHDLVTQIEKYIQHYWLYFSYNLWDTVYGITIASDYDEFSLKELKKLDVLVLKYSIINDSLILEGV